MINAFIPFVGGPQGPSFFCSFLPCAAPMATHGLSLRGNFSDGFVCVCSLAGA